MPAHRTYSILLLTISSLIVCPSANAQSGGVAQEETSPAAAEVLAGHSYHGEVFNDGPRQQAYLMDGLGRVEFPVTTVSAEAQQFVTQGIAQLHGFWYFEAERSFRQAAAIDEQCAMAYWGMAMANRNNQERAKGFIAEAEERKKGASRREQLYIESLHTYLAADPKQKKERSKKYTKALEGIVHEFPDDLEAKAFLIVQLWNNRNDGLPINSYLAVDALIEQVFAVEPMHPAHHYRIHLWDYERPEKALASAALCGQSLPAIAHMWHMPGHTYSRVKRYEDACWQQEASARVDHAHMMRDRVMPDQIHNFAHNNEWLIRNLNHVGRVADAIDLAKNMVELPRHPKYNHFDKRGSARYGRTRLLETLSRFELWDQLIALAETPYLAPTDSEDEQIVRLRYLGQAAFRSGNTELAEAQLAELGDRLARKQQQEGEAADDSDEKSAAGRSEGVGDRDADKQADSKTSGEEQDDEELSEEEKKRKEAQRKLRATKRKLEKAITALEGYRAVVQGEYEQGWKKLKQAGNADAMYLAKVQLLAGDRKLALKTARNHIKSHKNEVQPLAKFVDLLWFAEQPAEAKETFAKLREISSSIDLASPIFQRLAPVARAAGYADDWRIVKKPGDDVGDRPELGSLGPFRWQPLPAPDWTLVDHDGRFYSLSEFRSQPLLLIFYLGHGCLHCAEQLHAFAPVTEQFQQAGIQVLAISTDDTAGLQISVANLGGAQLPFPLLSNAELNTFRAYRAYDDFEQQPLHGTFLLDGEGQIRWQDISYEPFMDAEFVLAESQRLLSQ